VAQRKEKRHGRNKAKRDKTEDVDATHNTKREMPDVCGPIAEASPIPLVALEGAGHVIRYVNPAFCLLAGKPSEDVTGYAFRDVVSADDECLSLLARVLGTAQPGTHVEEASAPCRFYWSYNMWPILAAEGRATGVILQVTETVRLADRSDAVGPVNLRCRRAASGG
jgi:PAS domain-containing protein